MKAPQEVIDAFNHIAQNYNVSMVVFNGSGSWVFMDENFHAPAFTDDVDTNILAAAADALYNEDMLPFVYEHLNS